MEQGGNKWANRGRENLQSVKAAESADMTYHSKQGFKRHYSGQVNGLWCTNVSLTMLKMWWGKNNIKRPRFGSSAASPGLEIIDSCSNSIKNLSELLNIFLKQFRDLKKPPVSEQKTKKHF